MGSNRVTPVVGKHLHKVGDEVHADLGSNNDRLVNFTYVVITKFIQVNK